MEQRIEDKPFFLAVLTDKVIAKSETYMKICNAVAESNEQATLKSNSKKIKPMYVFVHRDVDWSDFTLFPWRKIFYFETEEEFDNAWEEMREDIGWFKKQMAI